MVGERLQRGAYYLPTMGEKRRTTRRVLPAHHGRLAPRGAYYLFTMVRGEPTTRRVLPAYHGENSAHEARTTGVPWWVCSRCTRVGVVYPGIMVGGVYPVPW